MPEENSYLCPSKPHKEGKADSEITQSCIRTESLALGAVKVCVLKRLGYKGVLVEVSMNVGFIQLISPKCTP